MVVVESEFDPVISKDRVYVMTKIAQDVAEKIEKKHSLPKSIVLKITARPQTSDAFIDYSDWKIVLDYNSMNVQKAMIEKRALEGLLAHEIMHIAHKLDGTEDRLIQLFTEEFKQREFGQDMFDFLKTTGLIVKDLFVNDSLVKDGFGEELFKHYLIVIHSRVRDNVLPFGELSRDRLDDFFLAMLGLFPSYASFYREGMNDRGDLVKSSINRHFSDIPAEIRAVMDELEASLLRVTLTEKGINEFVEEVLKAHSHLLSY